MKNYVYTDLSAKDALYLEIDGVRFQVAQYSSSWAANEIPTAVLMLAVGRDARTQTPAAVHTRLKDFKQMAKAVVWFTPGEEADRINDWPTDTKKIFEGYFLGPVYRKVSGKVQVVVNLLHWLAGLAFSSCLTANGHVSNPTAMNSAAVLESLKTTGGSEGNYISLLVPAGIAADVVGSDVWGAMKTIFCKMAAVETMPVGPDGEQCGGGGNYKKNDAALEALGRIEGPADGCDMDYRWGRPLKIDNLGISLLDDAVAEFLGHEFIESYAATSFWDKLIAQWCPMFGMAVVPMVEQALVVADVPAYNGGFWKEVTADDYDGYDLTGELHRPLRAVGVLSRYESQTQAGVNSLGVPPLIGGCYVEDSVKEGDGMIQYVAAPPWLQMLWTQSVYSGETTELKDEKPSKTATTPVDTTTPADTPDTFGLNANRLYQRYAHSVFVDSMLRGHGGSVPGKLRFDIAPLSIVRIKATTERFIGAGQDDLAVVTYGCVQRVTISINAEAGMAGTTLTYTHTRTEAENKEPRTSVDRHPLFGTEAIWGVDKAARGGADPAPIPMGKHGAPLIPAYDFDPPASPAPNLTDPTAPGNRPNLFAGDGPGNPAAGAVA